MKKRITSCSLLGVLLLTSIPFAYAETPSTQITEIAFPDGVHYFSMVDVIVAIGKGASFDQEKKEFIAQFDKVTIRVPLMPTTTVYINDKETTLSVPVFSEKKGEQAIIYAPKELFDKAGINIPNTNLIEIGKSSQLTSQRQYTQQVSIRQGPMQRTADNQVGGIADHPIIVINGVPLQTDMPALLKDNRVLVPIRSIFEGLKGTVNWDNDARRVDGSLGDKTVSLVIDDTNAIVNGVNTTLDVPAQIIDDHTMVPLRFISEALGAQVNWNGSNKTVTIDLK